MPKLRRNRKLESKWGDEYYTALNNAVFSIQSESYVPKLDPSINEYETLHMCTQCKDCFHFQSSLDDHIARKSWILGYWCQHCFKTDCTHSNINGLLCPTCSKIDYEKRTYLRRRGLRKNHKFGALRIFYNQCQFFMHLKAHDVSNVHVSDLMLMPIPKNLDNWTSEIEIICEALMEHTFILKVHMMDWLKDIDMTDNWWKPIEQNDNIAELVINRYKGRYYFKPLEIPAEEQFSILNISNGSPYSKPNISSNSRTQVIDSMEHVEKNTTSSSIDADSFSDGSISENEDTPCTTNEITFVDCGQTKYIESEVPSTQDSPTFQPLGMTADKLKERKNSVSSNAVMPYGNIIITPKKNNKDLSDKSPIKVVASSNSANNSKDLDIPLMVDPLSKVQSNVPDATKTDTWDVKKALSVLKQSVNKSVNSGQNIITIQSAKHVDINKIINQLPLHLKTAANNSLTKKIVLIRKDNLANFNKITNSSDASNSNSVTNRESLKTIHLVPDKSDKTVELKTNTNSKKLFEPSNTNVNLVIPSNTNLKQKVKSRPIILSKIIRQNGKKYILKGSLKPLNSKVDLKLEEIVQPKLANSVPQLIPLNPAEMKNILIKDKGLLQDDVTPLTPSPSPSELSSSSSCDVQSKQQSTISFEGLSINKKDDNNSYLNINYLNQKSIYTIVDTIDTVTRCREEMLYEFFHLSYEELKKRYDHLQQINEEISRVMSFVTENVIKENLKAVLILQTVLRHCIGKYKGKTDCKSNVTDPLFEDWESQCPGESPPVCKGCNKKTKPKHYVPGFSKPAQIDVYCSCYRHVCHQCNSYQGNSTRFAAHQTFHDKRKPYLCPDCYKKFSRFKLLEIHTWTTCFHTLKKRVLGCKICEVDGFQDLESVTRHFAIMHSARKIACEKCYLILSSYSDYIQHHKDKHPELDDRQPIRLVLCKLGRCIVRVEDYMSHMEKHSAVQRLTWFKCPYCAFIHVEPKRIVSHLRKKHVRQLKELVSSEIYHCLENVVGNESPSKFRNLQKIQTIPKIVNAGTITSKEFNETPGPNDHVTILSSKTLPKILNVRSIANSSPIKDAVCEEIGGLTNEKKLTASESIEARKKKDTEEEKSTELEINEIPVKVESMIIDVTCKEIQKSGLQSSSSQNLSLINAENHISDASISVNCSQTENNVDRSCDNANDASDNVEAKDESFTKPPPLTRIPQQALEANSSKKVVQSGSEKTKLPQRIAFSSTSEKTDIYNFLCHLCGELLNSATSIIKDHFQYKHIDECVLSTVSIGILRLSSEFINGGYKDTLSSKKRKSDGCIWNSKKRRRWCPKKFGRSANLGFCVEQETAEDSDGNFICKKCNQKCSDMVNLREHIASNHRIKGRYLVCLECGENFVVAPSLQMHLKAFHGIEDPITYMAQNTSYAPESLDELENGGKCVEPNQCHVCMAVFEDKATVDKHLRVHGMAFLNRKRIEAQNAMKSSEKKNEEKEEKQTSIKTSTKEIVRKDKPVETILEKITASI